MKPVMSNWLDAGTGNWAPANVAIRIIAIAMKLFVDVASERIFAGGADLLF